MIPRYNGAQSQKMTSITALPAGGYVARIESAKVESYSWGTVLVLAFDVAEGEFAGHFHKIFSDNTDPNKKWRGTFRLTVPNESSRYFASEKRAFNNFIYAVENSNNGFRFDWEETHLNGKFFGALVRNKEFFNSNGKKIMTTECGGCTDIQTIRDGSFTPLKDKLLNEENVTSTCANSTMDAVIDDDLPFN